jgi:2'-5' RNA ligase
MSMLLKQYITEKYVRTTRFDYGSFIIPITDNNFINYLSAIQSLLKRIDSKNIVQLEKEPHITILGGIKHVRTDEIRNGLKQIKIAPFNINIEDIMLFKNINDVIVLKCNSNQLNFIHRKLSELPHKKLHKDFIPHITIAYVKSGEGAKYLKSIKKYFKAGKLRINTIQYSDTMGQQLNYRLKDKVKPNVPTPQ